jgi:hypothetical protein
VLPNEHYHSKVAISGLMQAEPMRLRLLEYVDATLRYHSGVLQQHFPDDLPRDDVLAVIHYRRGEVNSAAGE